MGRKSKQPIDLSQHPIFAAVLEEAFERTAAELSKPYDPAGAGRKFSEWADKDGAIADLDKPYGVPLSFFDFEAIIQSCFASAQSHLGRDLTDADRAHIREYVIKQHGPGYCRVVAQFWQLNIRKLFGRYGIDEESPDRLAQLSLRLAIDYVPGFQFTIEDERKRGAPRSKWTPEMEARLLAQVDELVALGHSKEQAYAKLETRPEYKVTPTAHRTRPGKPKLKPRYHEIVNRQGPPKGTLAYLG